MVMKTEDYEVVRKFLPSTQQRRSQIMKTVEITQGYILVESGRGTLRVRQTTSADGRIQFQSEFKGQKTALGVPKITLTDKVSVCKRLLSLCGDRIISKQQQIVRYGKLAFEVDIFRGRHSPLVIIRLARNEGCPKNSSLPAWVGREVTDDVRYTNAWLSENEVTPDMLE
jgi:adenylate cyclase